MSSNQEVKERHVSREAGQARTVQVGGRKTVAGAFGGSGVTVGKEKGAWARNRKQERQLP